MAKNRKLTGLGYGASNIMTGTYRLVGRAVASLGVWFMPIIVGALMVAALSGSLSLHPGTGPSRDPQRAAIDGEKPFSVMNLYYSSDYIRVVKKAHEERRDILTDIQALESAWKAASPRTPLMIELVAVPSSEPVTENAYAPGLNAKVVIDETNFCDLRPLLDDLRKLILEGDGTGCGRLRCSGYESQPVETAKSIRSGSRDPKPGVVDAGPAKVITRAAEAS